MQSKLQQIIIDSKTVVQLLITHVLAQVFSKCGVRLTLRHYWLAFIGQALLKWYGACTLVV